MTSFDTLTAWVLAQIAEDEAMLLEDDPRQLAARLRADIEVKRGLVEWAQGAGCEDVVRIIAEGYADRAGWDEEWRV